MNKIEELKTSCIHSETSEERETALNFLLQEDKWISVLNECADKIREETYCENREEDNLVDHIVNEIRKFKPKK